MVFRLFVPAGEAQHQLFPKRPDPLGANATLQYSVLGSTAVAAAYTSFAVRYNHRVIPGCTLPRSALFIRSSAKLGLWAGILGVTAEWYYNSRFTSAVLLQHHQEATPWKLYERAKGFTVDDGCLIGAGLGLAGSIPALFMRRLAIPRWTRCVGLANTGACAGVLGAHAYLQHTGERAKAYVRLCRRTDQRSIAFWNLCWDKQAMARFNPLAQLYVRHNALWYAQHVSDSAYKETEYHDAASFESRENESHTATAESTPEYDLPFYAPPFDYLDELNRFSVEATYEKIEEHKAEVAALLKEVDFVSRFIAHRQYEYCHLGDVEDDERRQRLEELQVLQITHRKLRTAAEHLQAMLNSWHLMLRHRAIMDSPASAKIPVSTWLPPSTHDFTAHDPSLSIGELGRTQEALDIEIKAFEAIVANPDCPAQKRERRRQDLEDGRSLLRVTDKIVWEFEKMQAEAWAKTIRDQSASVSHTRELKSPAAGARVDDVAATKPSDKSLEIDKS